jgi:hypothetical protein
MLILTRDGLSPMIWSGNYSITGLFRINEITGVETFCLKFSVVDYNANTAITCINKHIDIEELKRKVTPFSDNPLPTTKGVDILYTRPGDLYVNGLFVCNNKNLTYGYNFAPSKIKLNRDRNMVDGLESQLARYYVHSSNAETVFHLLENGAYDVSYVYIWLAENKKLKAELARLFFNKYGDGAKIGRPGSMHFGNYVNCSGSSYEAYRVCGVQPAQEKPDPNAPIAILTSFLDANKKHMRRAALVSAKSLVNQAKAWKA